LRAALADFFAGDDFADGLEGVAADLAGIFGRGSVAYASKAPGLEVGSIQKLLSLRAIRPQAGCVTQSGVEPQVPRCASLCDSPLSWTTILQHLGSVTVDML
jgi:hypothetical protein